MFNILFPYEKILNYLNKTIEFYDVCHSVSAITKILLINLLRHLSM